MDNPRSPLSEAVARKQADRARREQADQKALDDLLAVKGDFLERMAAIGNPGLLPSPPPSVDPVTNPRYWNVGPGKGHSPTRPSAWSLGERVSALLAPSGSWWAGTSIGGSGGNWPRPGVGAWTEVPDEQMRYSLNEIVEALSDLLIEHGAVD